MIGAPGLRPELPFSALPPLGTTTAIPKYISGRTSYLRVRLAFNPFPQLIHQFCNIGWCGPPLPVTAGSPWPWNAHPVSGLVRATFWSPYSDSVSLWLRQERLNQQRTANSVAHSSIGTWWHTRRRAPTCLETSRFQDTISLPLSGYFSPFPHGTCSLSVR